MVSDLSCKALTATVNNGFEEMAVQQLDNLWQNSFDKALNHWSPSFSEDGWFREPIPVEIDTITTSKYENYYIEGDLICDPDINRTILDTVPTQVLFTEYIKDDIDHHNVIGAVDNIDFLTSLQAALTSGIGCPFDD